LPHIRDTAKMSTSPSQPRNRKSTDLQEAIHVERSRP
jgi:hypothetical protein